VWTRKNDYYDRIKVQQLRDYFEEIKVVKDKSDSKKTVDKNEEIQFFDTAKAQNLLIVISKLPSLAELIKSIETIDDNVITIEVIDSILSIWPTTSEIENLREKYKNNPEGNWRICEQ